MGNRKMSEAEMLRLAEAYQENEVLWRITDTNYRNREVRNEAYIRIREALNIPGLTLSEVAKKIKNLRSSYLQEIKKIEYSVNSGANTDAVYKPKVSWFETADRFLKEFTFRRRTMTNWAFQDMEDVSESCQPAASDTENSILLSESSLQSDNDSVQSKREIQEKKMYTKKHFKKMRLQDDTDDVVINALHKLHELRKEVNTEIDEYEAFGKYIAASLRNMPRKHFVTTKASIQQTLTEVELKIIAEDCNKVKYP